MKVKVPHLFWRDPTQPDIINGINESDKILMTYSNRLDLEKELIKGNNIHYVRWINNRLIRLENEIIQIKNEIVENRKYLIIIKEHLKADEKETVKKQVSYPIMPNNELKNYTIRY